MSSTSGIASHDHVAQWNEAHVWPTGINEFKARSTGGTLYLPSIVLGLYLTLPFYKPAVQEYFPVDITFVLAALAFIMAIPTALRTFFSGRSAQARHGAFVSSWILLGAVFTMGLLNSGSGTMPVQTTAKLFATVLLPLLVILPVVNRGPMAVGQVLDVLFAVGTIVTIVGVPFLLVSSSLARNTALGTNPINVATASMLVPAIGMTYIGRKSAFHRLMVLALSPLALVVSLSAARGPVVATVIAFFLVMLLRSRSSAIIGVLLGALLLLVLPSISATFQRLLPQFAAERLASLGDIFSAVFRSDSDVASSSDLVRLELYRIAGEMFKSSPVVGNGTDSFRAVTATIPTLSDLTHPHNLPLLFASEYGLIGLVVFIVVLVLAIRALVSNMYDYWGVTFGILFFSTLIEANLSGGMDNRLFWGITFLTLVLRARENREIPSATNADPVAVH